MINHIIDSKCLKSNKQMSEYGNLFDIVPCIITVQDRNYRILRYNREFSDKFGLKEGDYCYNAYKGLNKKCAICPLEKTFLDGKIHFSQQSGINKDGTEVHWIVKTSPIKNEVGKIMAAMEMSINITPYKELEKELKKSENKYYAIFNNIPNPVFVLDNETLEILDCNESITSVYGYSSTELVKKSFMDLFPNEDKDRLVSMIKSKPSLNRMKNRTKDGLSLFVNIRISPSEYQGRKVLLITTSDITKRLEAEQQLIQTSKLATLGEMATGVAHELNQPLSVIKTASTFLMKKTRKNEPVDEEILLTLLDKIDSNIDRASNIINHMRQFSRKSNMEMETVHINDVLEKSFEIFNEQLKVRGIELIKDIEDGLPATAGNANRLEQVFINLLLNARDAVEENWSDKNFNPGDKRITVSAKYTEKNIVIEVSDTGSGVPKAILDKVFEPFFTTKEVGKGTGLGLSISFGIIKDCGGTIQVDNGKHNGATFIIKLPMQSEKKLWR